MTAAEAFRRAIVILLQPRSSPTPYFDCIEEIEQEAIREEHAIYLAQHAAPAATTIAATTIATIATTADPVTEAEKWLGAPRPRR